MVTCFHEGEVGWFLKLNDHLCGQLFLFKSSYYILGNRKLEIMCFP